MKNPDIGRDEKLQIDKVVGRILSEFKGLEPPLNLKAVRDKLKLDLGYYSSKDPGLVQEMVHTIKVAGQEWLGPKTKLGKLIDRLGLRGMLFWDQNRILIDSDQHHAKHRWTEGHEVGHKLIPWHKHFLLGDSKNELSLDCHAAIEAEANYAAGQLLFLQKRFVEEAMSLPVSIASIKHLKQQFGNSNASTLWRFVEQHAGAAPLVGIVSDHPHRLPGDFDHKTPCRHVIESPAFRARFSNTTELKLFEILTSVCNQRSGGPLGTAEVVLYDNNGDPHEFIFESFCFRFTQGDGTSGYQVLTLALHNRKLSRVIVA